MSANIYDYLVVGSGCSGAMAAQTLVEAGVQVAMLDVGNTNPAYETAVPDKDYVTLRETDPQQYRYLLGEKTEGLSWGRISKGAQITPTRSHMLAQTDTYIPLQSTNFSPLESLGYGGLGIGWGLQCWEFSDADMKSAGLNPTHMRTGYETVSKRIGISATDDAASAYTLGKLKAYQPSPDMDENHSRIYRTYLAKKAKFGRHGLFVGRTPLALITKDLNGRRGYRYQDIDFYADLGRSAWRPWITVSELRKKPNFTYIGSRLVTKFSEKNGVVNVTCIDTSNDKTVEYTCRKLILASGSMGSARIVLRSLGDHATKLPILSNPHAYVPCLQPTMVGRSADRRKLGFGQLSYFIDPSGDDKGLSVATSYSYQELMLFRIINQVPLNFADSRTIMRYLMTGLIVMIIQHPDAASADKYLQLVKDSGTPTGDVLKANFELNENEATAWESREKQYVAAMRKLGVFALKRVPTEHGSSIHYAGTLPFHDTDKPFTLSHDGRLHGTQHVYVADSSGFNYLPAKGLTFSLLANAHITAENVLKHGN